MIYIDTCNKDESDMDQFEKLKDEVIDWACERSILIHCLDDKGDTRWTGDKKSQCLKMLSEAGEVADAVAKGNVPGVIDGLGDTLVTMIILAEMYQLDLLGCLQTAYNEIKDRKGEMVNGTFVKEEKKESLYQTLDRFKKMGVEL